MMRIKELRLAAGLTQVQLGAKVGVAQNCISTWENESFLPRVRDLPLLAKALGVSIEELFDPAALVPDGKEAYENAEAS